jgi:hypothetical protein
VPGNNGSHCSCLRSSTYRSPTPAHPHPSLQVSLCTCRHGPAPRPPRLLAPRTASPSLTERARRGRGGSAAASHPSAPPPARGGRAASHRPRAPATRSLVTAQRGGRPPPRAPRPPRAPCPRRAAPGGALRFASPLRADRRAGGRWPGCPCAPRAAGLGRGCQPRKGCGPRAAPRARPCGRPGCKRGQAARVRKARGNRCLTSADRINSRAAERGSPAAKSQEREREGASGGQRRAQSTGPRRGRPTPSAVGEGPLGPGARPNLLGPGGGGSGTGVRLLVAGAPTWPVVNSGTPEHAKPWSAKT